MSRVRPLASVLFLIGTVLIVQCFSNRLLAADPAETGERRGRGETLIEQAREAARIDRNAESASWFQQAIDDAPERRLEWLRELADQLTFSERAGQAIPLYRELLAADHLFPPERRQAQLGLALALLWEGDLATALSEYEELATADPSDVQARLGRARALSWMNRHDAALKEYATVLELDSGNLEAHREVARVESWRGRQHAAQRKLHELLALHPDDSESTIILAQSQEWMGRSDRAVQTLGSFLERHPEAKEARGMLEAIEVRQQPDVYAEYRTSRQSDDLAISQVSVRQAFRLTDVRTTVVTTYQDVQYTPGGGARNSITVRRPGGGLQHRFNDAAEFNGYVSLDHIEPLEAQESVSLLTYDSWVRLSPNDAVQLYLGSKRTTFDNVRSLEDGLTGAYASFSADFKPAPETVVTGRLSWGHISDGNRQVWGQLEVRRALSTRPGLSLGGRWTTFDFSRVFDHGYFNPSRYYSGETTVSLSGRAGARFEFELDGAVGLEYARPGGYKPVVAARTQLRYRIAQRLDFALRLEAFSTRQASTSGFSRSTFSSDLNFLW